MTVNEAIELETDLKKQDNGNKTTMTGKTVQ